jgi:hypothetical protein
MSSLSFGSNDDSTSICAADASLDIRYAFDMALKRSICVALWQRESKFIRGAIDFRCRRQHIECE